jgi:hypothetical protein
MKTQLDIYQSATAAAATTLDKTVSFEIEAAAIATFSKEKQDPRDWPAWKASFDAFRQSALAMRAAPAASEAGAETKVISKQ